MKARYRQAVFIVLAALAAVVYAWAQERNRDPGPSSPEIGAAIFRTIPAAEARGLIESRGEVAVIDVRTPQERQHMRIAGSRLVPVGDVIRGRLALAPDIPVLLVCAVGGRSYVAGKSLAARGYREVYNLDGGIEGWRRAGFPLEQGPE